MASAVTTIRCILAVLGGMAAGYVIASLLWFTITDVGVGVAISAACLLFWYLVKAIEDDQQRERDKARHPASYSMTKWWLQ
jgi:hypothetical protein